MIKFKQLSFLLFLTSGLFAQNNFLEEKKLAVDTLFFTDQTQALSISEATLPDAYLSADTNYITYFLDQAGELNRMAGNFDLAINQLSKCLGYKVNWQDLKDLSLTHNNLGKTYAQKGLYDLAVFHFFEALRLMEEDENLLGQSFYINNIAAVYDLQHNYNGALEYYNKSLSIKGQLGDEKGMAASYTNIGISYSNLGDYDQAFSFHKKAYNTYLKLQDTTRFARAANNLSISLIAQGDYTLAKQYSSEAFAVLESIFDEKLEAEILINAAQISLKLNELAQGRDYLETALNKAKSANSYGMLKSVYRIFADLENQSGDYEKANEMLMISIAYNDSLINEANIHAVADIQGKYEYERHQKEIMEGNLAITEKEKMIEKQRADITLWIGLALILFGIALIFLILYSNKQRKGMLLKGQLALLSQRKKRLEDMNNVISEQLDQTKISLEEKEELLNKLYESGSSKELPEELLQLSKREMEVLSYLALGWSDDQLAEKLFISKSTVKTHLRRIYSKLLVRGRAEAVAIAHKHNIIGEFL